MTAWYYRVVRLNDEYFPGLNLIDCQTGSPSHLNEHAKGEVEFVSPQLENVSLESLLVLSCKSFIGLKESAVRYFNDIFYLELAVSQAQHSCPPPNASKRSPVIQSQNMSIFSAVNEESLRLTP